MATRLTWQRYRNGDYITRQIGFSYRITKTARGFTLIHDSYTMGSFKTLARAKEAAQADICS